MSKVNCEDKKFYCTNGSVINNLNELVNELKIIDDESFSNHVNSNKNDFSNWIYDCLGDVKLVDNIRGITDAKSMSKKIKTRITYLKKFKKEDK